MAATDVPPTLLGGLSAAAFMRRHWQKAPLLVRGAWPGVASPLTRTEAFALAADGDVESRLVVRRGAQWTLRHGPLPRRALPPLAQPGWTLLLQGVDLHVDAAHEMLAPFRFVPAVRLDDLMVSWASPGGGVGPHTDAYDVFLLQVQGRRRWRVGPPVAAPRWVEGSPLKRLRGFVPTQQWVLEAGDLLYLPPHWGHDGTAVGGDCITCSIGFRTPTAGELAAALLQRLADDAADDGSHDAPGDAPAARRRDRRDRHYRDAGQRATAAPGALPPALGAFAARAVRSRLAVPHAVGRALGEWASEPKPRVWFAPGRPARRGDGLRLDRRSRMLHDDGHVYLNGEAFRCSGRDATLMRRLADTRGLTAADAARLGDGAWSLVETWCRDGWLHGCAPAAPTALTAPTAPTVPAAPTAATTAAASRSRRREP